MKSYRNLLLLATTVCVIDPTQIACGAEEASGVARLFMEGVISTPNSFGATFTPDGMTIYFNRSSGEGPDRRSTILVSHRDGDAWTPPQPVPFSGEFNDFDASLSPDGTQLFFGSVRPPTGPRPTLWVVEKTATGEWGAPRPLAAITGADGVAVFPSPAASGNLYFAGHRPGLASVGDDDIYVCRLLADGSYAAPENLGPAVNSPAQDYDGFIAPDESFLIFCSRRPGGIGPSDFYLCTCENGVWTPARNLGPQINSATSPGICCPSVSPDRKWFYFTSGRDGKHGIYRIAASALALSEESKPAARLLVRPVANVVPAAPPFTIGRRLGQFTLSATAADEPALLDVADALLQHAPHVCRALRHDYPQPVFVELFADQQSLDADKRSRWTRGHYAHSDERGIQMVSPRQPVPNLPLGYERRVLIAVHEFAHLVNHAVNPDMPLWLNESAAVFVAPHAAYTYVCQHRFPFDRVPPLRDLQQAYPSIQGADLFAFTVVDFLVAEFGLDTLNQLLRSPDSFETLFRMAPTEFERRWRQYLEQHYAHT